MKAEELRIGNIIEFLGNEIEVECISNATLRPDMYWIKPKGMSESKLIHFKPIELTEEWLLKFGFKNGIKDLLFLPIPESGMELHYEIHNYGNVVTIQSSFGSTIPEDIKYAHQLQNLYSALTQKELTFNQLSNEQ